MQALAQLTPFHCKCGKRGDFLMDTSVSVAQQLELKAQHIKNKCGALQVAIAIDGSGEFVVLQR